LLAFFGDPECYPFFLEFFFTEFLFDSSPQVLGVVRGLASFCFLEPYFYALLVPYHFFPIEVDVPLSSDIPTPPFGSFCFFSAIVPSSHGPAVPFFLF